VKYIFLRMNSHREILVVTILCVLTALFSFASEVKATTFGFEWQTLSGGDAYMLSSQDNLNSNYNSTIYNNGRAKWNSSVPDAHIVINGTTFSNSTVDMYSVSTTTWNNNGWGPYIAWAQMWNNGTACNPTPTSSISCTGAVVDYGAIYFNEGQEPASSTTRSGVIAHEIGHLAGLAHTTTLDPSLMTSYVNDPLWRSSPTTYDINQMNSLY